MALTAENGSAGVRRLFVVLVLSLLVPACVVVERSTTTSTPPPGDTTGPDGHAPQADPAPLHPSSDRRLVGSLGWALLSPEVPRAVIEVDRLGGAPLGQQAVEGLADALREHGGKRDVEVVEADAPTTDDVYTPEDLLATSREHRDHSSDDGTVALHVLVLPGRFQAEGVPGVAFHATAMALFTEEIRRVLPPGASIGAFEAAVATHELGHAFGLVNRTGVGDFHEDPEHPGHTADEDSVMYWAIESSALGQLFRTAPPSTFTEADRQEMSSIRDQRP
ncbi:MAG TPA: hypothetical protein VG455_13120 [Acidimicrobiales bacterium]|nr:hypothetical protein [Acidimicrobiales bacterium]